MNDDVKSPQPLQPVVSARAAAPLRVPDPLELPDLTENNGSGAPQGSKFSPRQLLAYRWSIIAVAVVIGGIGITGSWASFKPEYTATANIEVTPVRVLLTGGKDQVDLYETWRQTQARFVRGPEVLDAVLDRPEVRETNWFRDEPVSPLEQLQERLKIRTSPPPRDRLVRDLKVLAPGGAQLITVEMTATAPGEAKRIVDAIVRRFVDFANKRDADAEIDRERQLEAQIRERERSLSAVHGLGYELEQVIKRLGTAAPEPLQQQRLLRLDEMAFRLRQLEVQLSLAEETATAAATASGEPSAGPTPPPTDLQTTDTQYRRLFDELEQARKRLEGAPAQFGELHPVMQELQRAVQLSEERLTRYEEQLAGIVSGDPALAMLDPRMTALESMRREFRQLKTLVEEEQTRYNAMFDDIEKKRSLDLRIAETESTLAKLRRELEHIQLNKDVQGRIRGFPAYEPTSAGADKRVKFMAASVFGGLAAGIMLAFVRLKLSGKVFEANEVVRPSHGTFLGHIPLRRVSELPGLAECPFQMEAIRVIRTALLNQVQGARTPVVQVTSASVGAGKTTFASLLARSLAQMGKRVLLIDADIRRSSISRHFQVEHARGLVNLLQEGDACPTKIFQTSVPNLSLLPAGHSEHIEDVELLANGVFSKALDRWRTTYDVILLDGAPLLGTADGAILSRHADGSVLVVREQHCKRTALVDALASLGAAGGRLLGTVFVGGGAETRYGYGYGYGYAGPRKTVKALDVRDMVSSHAAER